MQKIELQRTSFESNTDEHCDVREAKMVITCKVVYDAEVVYSDQNLSGTVHLFTTNTRRVGGVKIRIEGKSRVAELCGNTTYRTERCFLKAEKYVAGSSDGNIRLPDPINPICRLKFLSPGNRFSGRIELTPGLHTFNFQYKLPPDIPSTLCRNRTSSIDTLYEIRVVVDIPFWMDKKSTTPFTVIRTSYLTDETRLVMPNSGKIFTHIGSL